ncbi:TPA: hypothetical protein U1C26_001833 [Streptococcus suis]|nr:hypothetical protein [Streptococcus suis]
MTIWRIICHNYLDIEDKVAVKREIPSLNQLFTGANGEKRVFMHADWGWSVRSQTLVDL